MRNLEPQFLIVQKHKNSIYVALYLKFSRYADVDYRYVLQLLCRNKMRCVPLQRLHKSYKAFSRLLSMEILDQIVLAAAGIFWAALLGSLFYRFQVPPGDRAEYDRMVKSFSYPVALVTFGSLLFWLGDQSWATFFEACLKANMSIIRALALGLFYFFAFLLVWRIWRRRVRQ